MTNDSLKGAWEIAVKQLEEENRALGAEKSRLFNSWFDLEYSTSREEAAEGTTVISVRSMNQMTWEKQKSLGYVSRLTRLISAAIFDKESDKTLLIEPKFEEGMLFEVGPEEKTEKAPTATARPTRPKVHNGTLYPQYNFETFIPGSIDSPTYFAYKAALDTAANPGKRNPILFYGNSGLGKTHLMNAIGNYINENSENAKKIAYIQAESFTNEFTNSLKQKNVDAFKNKYRKLDVLLLDDIQFLQGKEGVQQELFYTFEALHKARAQMVFACDRPPSEMKRMEERLVSRLSSGMTLDLKPPNFETRCAIIQKKVEGLEIPFPGEVIEYIARTVTNNVRALESAIQKVAGYADLMSSDVTVDLAREMLEDDINRVDPESTTIQNILEAVAKYYGLGVQELRSKKKDKRRAIPRQVAMYLCRELTEYGYADIGAELGGRNHATVMYGCDKIKMDIGLDGDIAQAVETITRQVKIMKEVSEQGA